MAEQETSLQEGKTKQSAQLKTQPLIPKLRFKEFDGEWKKYLLSDFIDEIGSGWSPKCLTEPAKKGEWGSLKTTSITWKGYAPWENKKLPNKLQAKEDIEVCVDDILITRVGPIDRVGVVVHVNKKWSKLMVSDNMFRLKLNKNIKPAFTPLILGSFSVQKSWNRKIAGLAAAQVVINQKTINKTTLRIPSLPEQQKIASFLSAVDEKIQQLTQKKSLLEQYKKGVMQQLFSGKLRFKDEKGEAFSDWEWVQGNILFDNISDKKHNSDLPILAITQDQGAIPRELINYQMTVTEKSIASYKVVQVGDFIISLRTFQGGIEYSEYHGICSPAYIILRPSSDNVDRTFYKLYLKTSFYIKQLQKNLEGIRDGKMISYKYFSEIKLPFPSLKEQQKIADYLSAIDTKIETVNQQIEKTQAFKKGLLQQMFV